MKKFLVIQTAFIGDVILATAVVEKLHRFYPDAHIDFLVRRGNESLVNGHPYLNSVLVWDKKKNKYRGLLSLLWRIRMERYDEVINLQRFAASGFLTAFSRARVKKGFDKNPLSFLFTKKFPHVIGTIQQPGDHEVIRCLRLVEDITDTSFQVPRLYPGAADELAVSVYSGKPFVTISPASVWFTKQTPAPVWIEHIRKHSAIRYYLLGGPGDTELCESIRDACPDADVIVLAGKLSLLQSAALMRSAVMNYTNDSAPLHLCSAMNAPVTAVFCSTIPEFGFGPLSDISSVVQTHLALACKPCGLHGYSACPLGHFKCSVIDLPA